MRLDICIFGIEQLAYAVDCKLLDLVDYFASSVISGARITFSIFVSTDRAQSFKHLVAHIVFGGNELDAHSLPFFLFFDQIENLQILFHRLWVYLANLLKILF